MPLWGVHIGLNVVQIGLVAGLTAGMEILMFLPAGMVMDRLGRRYASVPATLLLALGLAATPLAQSFAALLAVGLIGAVGNGLGSGINMTYGADLAPAGRSGQFLGLWRLISDIGSVLGPTIAGAAAAVLSLAGSALAVGVWDWPAAWRSRSSPNRPSSAAAPMRPRGTRTADPPRQAANPRVDRAHIYVHKYMANQKLLMLTFTIGNTYENDDQSGR